VAGKSPTGARANIAGGRKAGKDLKPRGTAPAGRVRRKLAAVNKPMTVPIIWRRNKAIG
jgi:hypothetical protein